jgi:hypothetical protein
VGQDAFPVRGVQHVCPLDTSAGVEQDGEGEEEARQELVPDFLLELDGERGQKRDELAELKVVCCCPSRYTLIPPHPFPDREYVKAVDKRARVLTEEYIKKARNVDRMYWGAAEGTVGRVERKLVDMGEEVRGLVFGAFGEASSDASKEFLKVLVRL